MLRDSTPIMTLTPPAGKPDRRGEIDRAEVRRVLAVLADPAHGVELRGLPSRRSFVGPAADLDALAAAAAARAAAGDTTYYCLNPVPADLGRAARDGDVLRRRWLLIDADPVRDPDVSATGAEKQQALALAVRVRELLCPHGWPAPVLIDSGNGYHLLYRADLANDDAARDQVKQLLRHLAGRLDTAAATIDQKVYNASRVAKLPGTWARKGPDTPERPHRLARLVEVPEPLEIVPAETIRQTAGLVGGPTAPGPDPVTPSKRFGLKARAAGETSRERSYALAGLKAECDQVATAPAGGRNDQLNRSSFAVGQLLRPGVLERAEATARLREAAVACGLDRDPGCGIAGIEATIKSGLDAGAKQPRTAPDRDGGPPVQPGGTDPARAGEQGEGFRNFYTERRGEKDGKKGIRRGYPIQTLAAQLLTLTGGWPRRVNNLLFAEAAGPKPLWLETPAQLFAWIAGRLPAGDGGSGLVWASGADMASEGRFHAYLAQTAEVFDALELYPHFPALPRHFYLHPGIPGGDGKALGELLARFAPASNIDADLVKAFFLSMLWGGPPGARPAWIFTAEDDDPQGGRGVGKSTVAKAGARLVGGHIDLATNERMPDVITRLLSPDALERRVVLLDNVKTLKLSWGELEALVTTDSVSGHRLYHGEGRRPNTLTYCLTLNGASLSRDLAQRCVIVKLKRPAYSGTWEEETIALIEGKRWEIIGDILATLRAGPVQELTTHGRWGAWERAVLSRVAEPAECQKVILERQEEADDDASEAELVRGYFVEELEDRSHDVKGDVVWIDSQTAAEWCNHALGDKRATNKATNYLRGLSIPELQYSRRGHGRGWIWRGSAAPRTASPMRLKRPQSSDEGGKGGLKATAADW